MTICVGNVNPVTFLQPRTILFKCGVTAAGHVGARMQVWEIKHINAMNSWNGMPFYNGMYVYFECVFHRFRFSTHAYSSNAARVLGIPFVIYGGLHGLEKSTALVSMFPIRSYSCKQMAWLQFQCEWSVHTKM